MERWLLGEGADGASDNRAPSPKPRPEHPESQDQLIREFMADLKASSQEWVGRVRLINLESIQDHLGPNWDKLKDRVGILAEKIIQGETSARDRYSRVGDTEFIVFFADATPEESRIRCLGIVEIIHEKLFGSEASRDGSLPRVAECHILRGNGLALDWETARSAVQASGSPPAEVRAIFHEDPEILDAGTIAASSQAVIDAIIARGVESRTQEQLAPLMSRLKFLSRGLRALEPALAAPKEERNAGSGKNDSAVFPAIWADITELVSVLESDPDRSHADLLAALNKLQRDRACAAANPAGAPGRDGWNADQRFEYVPIYRSIGKGDRIVQGIYRVSCRIPESASNPLPRDEAMKLERLTLEYAIRYLLHHETGAEFMLLVSVHAETLRGPHSQMQYSTILRSAQLRARPHLLIEVVGYRDSDDTIGMRRAIDELRVHSQAVFLTLSNKNSDADKAATECKKLGVHALGMNASQFSGRKELLVHAVTRIASLGEKYAIPIFIDGISSVPVLAKAIASGASYVCAPTLRPPVRTPSSVDTATLDDIYTRV
jgi:GGDEF domain-containing protein